jgi:hypothetical protein
MPFRAAGILTAVFGLLAVAGLVLVGIDVYAALKRGPKWRRRLIGAGLALLGALGGWFSWPKPEPIMTCYAPMPVECVVGYDLRQQLPLLEKLAAQDKLDAEVVRKVLLKAEQDLNRISDPRVRMPGPERAKLDELRRQAEPIIKRLRERLGDDSGALERSAEWKTLVEAWKVAAQSRDIKEKRKGLDATSKAIEDLTNVGLLTVQESKLLTMELGRLEKDYLVATTCYDSMFVPPSEESLERLSKRLPLLTALARGRKLHPKAMERIVAAVEADLAQLSDPKLTMLAPAKARQAKNLCRLIQDELTVIKKLVK